MRILLLTNNDIGAPLAEWLSSRPEQNEVIVHQEKLAVEDLRVLQPELVVSYSYRHILRQEVLDVLPEKFINLHISFLPFNRGADPNAWSFLEDTPKGVSIHLIDRGVDTGRILVQKQVIFDEEHETLGSAYSILHEEIQELFRESWDKLRSGAIEPAEQKGACTFHSAKEFAEIQSELLGAEGWNVKIGLFKSRFRNIKLSKS
jgi:dTDP-4-amino-4,6-dideoxyglucose formyltransferase